MAEHRVEHIIKRLQKRWTTTTLLALLITSIAVALLMSAVVIKLTGYSWGIGVLLLIVAFCIGYFALYKKLSEVDIATFLNKSIPAVEESATLVLKPADSLSFLEKL